MIQGYAIPNATMLGNNGAYKSEFYKALEGAKAAGATVEDAPCLLARGVNAYNAGLPSTPSLLIVPQFYKAGNLYQDVPPFVAEDSTMRFTVSRNTTATRVNSSGLIESVASGVPRIDWLGQSCPGLLVEPSAQNLAWHSETWAAANNWSLSEVTRATGSTDAFKAPDGTFTANAISPTSGNVQHRLFGNISTNIAFTSGTIYTQSAFFKAGTGNAGRYVQLTFQGTQFSQLGFANFDLQNGVIVASGGTADANRNARIENYGNGWYRCSLTATCNVSGSTFGLFPSLITASGDSRAPSFAGTVTDVLYGWGAQLETGSVATTYIPTTSGTGSRAADVISASGALVSSLIGQTEGTIYAEVDVRNLAIETYIIRIDEGASSNNITLRKLNTNQIRTAIVAPTTSGTLNISSAAFTAGIIKIAFAYKSGEIALSVNGATPLTANGTFAFGAPLNRITLGSNQSPSSEFNDRIRSAAIYTTRLSNEQLANLTRL
jgi:hypothetical protein